MKKALLFLFLLIVLFSSYALDIKSGSIMLSLDERSGILKLYHISDNEKTKTSLLYEQDTRTSYVLIASGNRLLKLNDNFSSKVEQTENSIKITYTSDIAIVVLDITPVSSGGFSFLYTVFNTTKQDTSIGCRILLDSYLGEKASSHFSSNLNAQIQTETLFSQPNLPLWIESSNEKKIGFRIFLPTTKSLQPDAVLLANWKRINDAVWQPEFQQNRNFTLAPYSINDSAVALFWNAQTVKPSEKRTFSFTISTIQVTAVETPSISEPLSSVSVSSPVTVPSVTATPSTPSSQLPQLTQEQLMELLKKDYQTALTILQMINTLLANSQSVTEADIAKIQAMIDELTKKKGHY